MSINSKAQYIRGSTLIFVIELIVVAKIYAINTTTRV